MNNKGSTEDVVPITFMIVFSIYVVVSFYGFSSWDSDIKSGNKFKIRDEVYSCKLEQKLEYGEKK